MQDHRHADHTAGFHEAFEALGSVGQVGLVLNGHFSFDPLLVNRDLAHPGKHTGIVREFAQQVFRAAQIPQHQACDHWVKALFLLFTQLFVACGGVRVDTLVVSQRSILCDLFFIIFAIDFPFIEPHHFVGDVIVGLWGRMAGGGAVIFVTAAPASQHIGRNGRQSGIHDFQVIHGAQQKQRICALLSVIRGMEMHIGNLVPFLGFGNPYAR
ncbi:hypothetical protein D9M69_528810 [compost metagenome]